METALATHLAQRCTEPFEVLLLDGHGAALAREPEPPVRWIRCPGADVFELRAIGAAAARGELIVVSEDHCLAPPDWLERTSVAHRVQAAPVIVGPVVNHADTSARAVDRANFALTLGHVAPPLLAVSRARLPVPTNLSFKREALPAGVSPSGWLEYAFLGDALHRGQIAAVDQGEVHHRQTWSARAALAVHFQSGRSYGASVRAWPAADRRIWWRALTRRPGHLYGITEPVLRRHAAGARSSHADRVWLLALVLANVAGQAVGALRGAGSSRRWL